MIYIPRYYVYMELDSQEDYAGIYKEVHEG